jgi:hypothetical protein
LGRKLRRLAAATGQEAYRTYSFRINVAIEGFWEV